MNKGVYLLAAAGGFAVGAVYFGLLWFSVRRLAASRRPAAWALGSWAVRLAIALGGFYVIGAGDWRRFLWALGGFAVARLVLVKRWGERAAGGMGPEAVRAHDDNA